MCTYSPYTWHGIIQGFSFDSINFTVIVITSQLISVGTDSKQWTETVWDEMDIDWMEQNASRSENWYIHRPTRTSAKGVGILSARYHHEKENVCSWLLFDRFIYPSDSYLECINFYTLCLRHWYFDSYSIQNLERTMEGNCLYCKWNINWPKTI